MKRFHIKKSIDEYGEYSIRHHDGVIKGYFYQITSFDDAIRILLRDGFGKQNSDGNIIEFVLDDDISKDEMRSDYASIKWHSMKGKWVAHIDLVAMAKWRKDADPDIDRKFRIAPLIIRGVGPIFPDLFDGVKYGYP